MFRRKLPELPAGLKLPRNGICVATWNAHRNGWQYSDYTNDWRGYSFGQCFRLFKRMVPYAGMEQAVLIQHGVIWAYKWHNTNRWQATGTHAGGRWVRESVKVTGEIWKRCYWLRLLGIRWINL